MKNNPVPVMLNTICELYPVNEIPKFSSEADTDQMEQQTQYLTQFMKFPFNTEIKHFLS